MTVTVPPGHDDFVRPATSMATPAIRRTDSNLDAPTRFMLPTTDRFFPADFERGIVRERLGIGPTRSRTGHLPALAKPEELAAPALRRGNSPVAAIGRSAS
jgi:hypothetical protein